MNEANWLDRAIGWVSPERGLQRQRARQLSALLSGYEGARRDRRTDGWVTTGGSADTEILSGGVWLRNNARDLVRNNPYATRGLEVRVANTIGTGIVAEVKNKRLRPMWEDWIEELDATGDLDLYGIQSLAERTRAESGEALIRFVPRPASAGLTVPLQVQVLEPDYIDASKNASFGTNIIRAGIERDASGVVKAYWLLPAHPGETGTTAAALAALGRHSERVPARDVIHLFRQLRAGQTRGVTDFAPVMLRLRGLDDYDDAEVMRKKIEACLAAFVTTPQGADGLSVGPTSTDAKSRVEQLFPGMVEYLGIGESVTFSDPKSSGGYADFQRFGLRAIAAGIGIPYELMTGDLSTVNYSSYRAGLVDFRRRIEQDQWLLHVPRVCNRIWARFRAEVAAMRGNLGARAGVEWTPPRFELIDPLKETQAELEACLAGFDTWPEIVRRRGWTAEEQLTAIQEWQKDLAKRGIVLKSDASQKLTASSAAEPAAEAA